MFSGPASTTKSSSRPAAESAATAASNAAMVRLLTSTLPIVVVFGNRIEPPSAPLSRMHLTIASPPIAAAEASWPVWLMLLRSLSPGSKLLKVATGMPSSSALAITSL